MFFSKILLGARYVQSAIGLTLRFAGSKLSRKQERIFDQALTVFYSNKYRSSEKEGMLAIESLRKRLLQSKAEMKRVEFGQGSNVLSNSDNSEKVSDVCRIMSKSENECRFLYSLIRTIKPKQAIELGTCLGISTAYIGQALVQNNDGHLSSFEGSSERAGLAIQNIKELGLEKVVSMVQGRFQDTLQDYLNRIQYLDFAFIDGHHQEDATLHYFNLILPKFSKGGILVFDDIFWSSGMNRAWQTIKSNDQVVDSFVFRGMGVVSITNYEL